MEKLREMLNLDGINNQIDLKKHFDDIAKYIFTNIEIHPYNDESNKYKIIEIEFYWNAPYHKDTPTNKRQCNAGDICFFYGEKRRRADICFKSDKEHYGGILLRSIKDKKDKVTRGPNRVKNILFKTGEDKNGTATIDSICEINSITIDGYIEKMGRKNIKNEIYDYNYSFTEKIV